MVRAGQLPGGSAGGPGGEQAGWSGVICGKVGELRLDTGDDLGTVDGIADLVVDLDELGTGRESQEPLWRGPGPAEAEARLREALAILQQIGSAEAADVSAELDALPGAPDPASTSP